MLMFFFDIIVDEHEVYYFLLCYYSFRIIIIITIQHRCAVAICHFHLFRQLLLWLVVDSGIYTHTCCVCAGIDIQQHLVEKNTWICRNFGGLNASGGSLVFRHCTARHGGGLDAQVLSVLVLDRWKMGVTWHYPKINRLCNPKGGFVLERVTYRTSWKSTNFIPISGNWGFGERWLNLPESRLR